MRFLLDTNVISEAGKKTPNGKVMNWLLQHEADSGVPAMAISERAQGIYALQEPDRSRKLEALKSWLSENNDLVVPFDSDCAIRWGDYVESQTLKLTPKGVIDTQIAAIALAKNLILVTRNVKDFPDVQTLNPWE